MRRATELMHSRMCSRHWEIACSCRHVPKAESCSTTDHHVVVVLITVCPDPKRESQQVSRPNTETGTARPANPSRTDSTTNPDRNERTGEKTKKA